MADGAGWRDLSIRMLGALIALSLGVGSLVLAGGLGIAGASGSSNDAFTYVYQGVPVNIFAPTLKGTDRVGFALDASNGVWTHHPSFYYFEWLRCGRLGTRCVEQYTYGSAYPLSSADVGHRIRVIVTAGNQYGTGRSAESTASPVISY